MVFLKIFFHCSSPNLARQSKFSILGIKIAINCTVRNDAQVTVDVLTSPRNVAALWVAGAKVIFIPLQFFTFMKIRRLTLARSPFILQALRTAVRLLACKTLTDRPVGLCSWLSIGLPCGRSWVQIPTGTTPRVVK